MFSRSRFNSRKMYLKNLQMIKSIKIMVSFIDLNDESHQIFRFFTPVLIVISTTL